ncbi:hypothetical protein GCM10010201_34140 [Pilimelia columellifera subsp. columellifera]|uniref:Uncharacterized protein n=1 Tax=Pilimelia columellifera subsp. columellifera TaxID=706583 RepID=A0ABP6B133_9ACTN
MTPLTEHLLTFSWSWTSALGCEFELVVAAGRCPSRAIVKAIRDLFIQQQVGTDIWIALGWRVGFLIVAYFVAMATYRRRIS